VLISRTLQCHAARAAAKATLIKVPISGTTSDFDPLIAQCEISALRLA
jgi:hypothetical protein